MDPTTPMKLKWWRYLHILQIFGYPKTGRKKNWVPLWSILQPNIRRPAWLTTWICWKKNVAYFVTSLSFTPHDSKPAFYRIQPQVLEQKLANQSLKQPLDDVHSQQKSPQVTWKEPWLPWSPVASLSLGSWWSTLNRTHVQLGEDISSFKLMGLGPRWWIPKSVPICWGQNLFSIFTDFLLEMAGISLMIHNNSRPFASGSGLWIFFGPTKFAHKTWKIIQNASTNPPST